MNDHARVLFFATLRDKAGVRETDIEFPHGAHIADIKKTRVGEISWIEAEYGLDHRGTEPRICL